MHKYLIFFIIFFLASCATSEIHNKNIYSELDNYPQDSVIFNDDNYYVHKKNIGCILPNNKNFVPENMVDVAYLGTINENNIYEFSHNISMEEKALYDTCKIDGLVLENISTHQLSVASGDMFVGLSAKGYDDMQLLQKHSVSKQKIYTMLAIHIAKNYQLAFITLLFDGEVAYMRSHTDQNFLSQVKKMRDDIWISYVSLNIVSY